MTLKEVREASETFSIEISTDNREAIRNATEEAIKRGLEEVGMQVENYATMLCPVDTGLLRNSITHAVAGQSTKKSSYSSESRHADTKVTQKYGTANKPVKNVKRGSYDGTAGSSDELAVYIGTNVEYAPYVEYGTSHNTAKPFLEPAVKNHVDEYKSILVEQIESAVE